VSDNLLPLELLHSGACAVVEHVDGQPDWVGRLAALGIRHGCRLEVVRPGSPCLLQIDGCRLCLRGDEGCRIFVRPVS
jgi:ferrous iron transport protein A